MKSSLAALAFLVSACASSEAPASLQAIKDGVDGRITYSDYAKRDWRYVPQGQEGEGNCAVYGATYAADAASAGYRGKIKLCVLTDGVGHAFYETDDGWVLDVRQKFVGRYADVGCQP